MISLVLTHFLNNFRPNTGLKKPNTIFSLEWISTQYSWLKKVKIYLNTFQAPLQKVVVFLCFYPNLNGTCHSFLKMRDNKVSTLLTVAMFYCEEYTIYNTVQGCNYVSFDSRSSTYTLRDIMSLNERLSMVKYEKMRNNEKTLMQKQGLLLYLLLVCRSPSNFLLLR